VYKLTRRKRGGYGIKEERDNVRGRKKKKGTEQFCGGTARHLRVRRRYLRKDVTR